MGGSVGAGRRDLLRVRWRPEAVLSGLMAGGGRFCSGGWYGEGRSVLGWWKEEK